MENQSILLKVKTKDGQHVIKDLAAKNTIKDLKQALSKFSSLPIGNLQVLCGFPPKPLDISQDDLYLAQSGVASGDTLILQELSIPPEVTNKIPQVQETLQVESSNDLLTVDSNKLPGILLKHIVPADNSCLFTSINFVLNGKIDSSGEAATYLRQLVAETILNEKHIYDEAMLGKPIEQYCSWIQNDTSWVVDTINAIINRFGEDQNYPLRVLLMFDGIHYDPLYMEPFDGSKIQTIFETGDERVLQEAKILADEAKSSRQFTDVNKFTLKCLVCNVMLKGQVEAQSHAKSTNHMNFGEV
ncbi:ubiquitin thioesterase Otu1 isoform X2 [Euwallacea fornicatus]|uniref:ubiquitin thioesterase Otu1 isoform X2 n=1 Tax=Euwallacea fornicatus TaxID=995702 RepID=UPI00338FCD1D